ncbi:hypothetical protein FHS30_001254 [Simiduia aestuariiviva]|uniref:Uncharacterized protein n=1 Tax=Simiduia aestuariiviva TaxID=1510459 RepID=A0A839UNF4_9GAMM|nr:hypothetical protein [Simiduia aestuariiviva]
MCSRTKLWFYSAPDTALGSDDYNGIFKLTI